MTFSPEEESLQHSLMVRQSSTVASLVVLLYEYLVTSRQEVRYIWRAPVKLNQIVYLFSRYFGIIIQSVNTYLTLGPHSRLYIAADTCRKWVLFQALGAYILSGTLHLILMLTVFALHLKDAKIGIFLILLFLYQVAMQAFVTPKALIHIDYDPICDTRGVHSDTLLLLGMSTFATYVSLVVLAAVKRNLLKLGAPVLKRVFRDGAWTIISLTSVFTAMVAYMWTRRVLQGHFMFGWSSTIVSLACCRIILNMETLDIAEPQREPSVGFNSADSTELRRLERERRQDARLETESGNYV